MEEGKLDVVDEQTIMEMSTFEVKGQSYEATEGNHDDLVMNFVLMGYFITTPYFQELTNINVRKTDVQAEDGRDRRGCASLRYPR